MSKIKLLMSASIAPAFSRISKAILNFFRSIFKKRRAMREPEPVIELKPEKPKKMWRTSTETRSLLKQLSPGDQLFDKAGNSLFVYKILYRRKIGVFVEDESGQRWKIHFMGLQSKTFSPDLP